MGVSLRDTINGSNIIGVVNIKDYKNESKPLDKYIRDYLNTGGGIVYIYSRCNNGQNSKNLLRSQVVELEPVYNPGKVIFICKDDYLKENKIDIAGFLNGIDEELIVLDKSGCKEKLVYVNIDQWDECIEKNDLQYIFNRLKTISKVRNVKFIFRYTMEKINLDYNNVLLMNHELLLIEREDDFEIQTPMGLINQSSKDESYVKGMKKIEHIKSLGDIIEGAVHDVNNLLATISGYAQLSLLSAESSEMTECLEIISKTALDGANTMDNIRSYVRESSNDKKAYYDFDNIINNCIMMAKYKFKSSYLRDRRGLGIEISLNSKAIIYGNEYEIRQSILNIILNGVDAMEDSGILTVKTYDHKRQAVIEISDTGTGMDKEIMDKIFDPYFTTKESQGTGLGLNIVKNMVEKHNGQISVESTLGKGSKFTLYFPIARYKSSTVTDVDKYFKNA